LTGRGISRQPEVGAVKQAKAGDGMLKWFHRLVPSQGQFYPLFEQHAAVVVAGARALRAMLAGGDQVKLRCDEILALEHQADGFARDVLLGLRTSFITPFDRADIQSLITSMDDSIDQMKQTAKAIVLFEVTDFEPDMRHMADAIVQCSELVQRAVAMLPDLANNAPALNEVCLQITKIEERHGVHSGQRDLQSSGAGGRPA
jgi:uncharacterized protein